jgi:hypothetical protein
MIICAICPNVKVAREKRAWTGMGLMVNTTHVFALPPRLLRNSFVRQLLR